MKEKLCPEQDLDLRLPAILVGHDIHYTIGSWICGNFIDVNRLNAANRRDVFPSDWPLSLTLSTLLPQSVHHYKLQG